MSITEILGRYALTGLILSGATVILLVIRILFIGSKYGCLEFIYKLRHKFDEEDKEWKTKEKKYRIVRWIIWSILWPFGLIMDIVQYMRIETACINEIIKQNEAG